MEYVSFFETSFGTGVVLAGTTGIRRLHLPHVSTTQLIDSGEFSGLSSSALTEDTAQMLTNYFKGERQRFEVVPVELILSGTFRVHVLQTIRSIPYGVVRSYGEVALLAGSPRSARAVGGAMAANPVPIIIPCHRVISGNGRLTGYTAPGGLGMKKIVLQMEGVEFKGEVVCQEK